MCQLFGCDSGTGNEGLRGLGTRDFTLQSDNVHVVGCDGGTGEEGVEKRQPRGCISPASWVIKIAVNNAILIINQLQRVYFMTVDNCAKVFFPRP